MAKTPDPELVNPDEKSQKLPRSIKFFAGLAIALGVLLLPYDIFSIVAVAYLLLSPNFAGTEPLTLGLYIAYIVVLMLVSVLLLIGGVKLIRGKRRTARLLCETQLALVVVATLINIMINGIGLDLIPNGIAIVVLIILHTYIDPSLSGERELQRKLRKMELREEAEEGTLGLDQTGKGYIALNFYNLFWIFVVASVLGLIIETVHHMIFVDPGVYQDRTGMLWGPFSPIYGFGAVLMTLALNRFHKSPFPIIFLVSAIIGGAFEFFVSWFLQTAFGIVAWDYSGTFLNIQGRTNFEFMCFWGALGLIWIKLLLPWMLKLVNKIPWNWRYTITTIAAAFMIADGVMTLITLDCWYQRMAGMPIDTAIEQFCAVHYDNQFMADRFQSMTLNPDQATRIDR